MTAFRISGHKLQIECGRYINKKMRTDYAPFVIILRVISLLFENVFSISYSVQKMHVNIDNMLSGVSSEAYGTT